MNFLVYGEGVIKRGKYSYYMDRFLKSNLDIFLNEAIPNKWDGLFIITGREGSGKSYFTSQIAAYCDINFGIKYCVYTPQQFENAIDYCKPESSIMWDEAITGANVSTHASKISVSIVSKLTQIRKKRLKIFLCFPYLSMLNKYFIARSIGGFYIYAKNFADRGHGLFYDSTKLQKLYFLMKEKFRYNPQDAIKVVKPNFPFNYPNVLTLDEKEYDLKKEKSRIDMAKNDSRDLWKDRLKTLIDHIRKNNGYTWNDVAKLYGIRRPTLIQNLQQ